MKISFSKPTILAGASVVVLVIAASAITLNQSGTANKTPAHTTKNTAERSKPASVSANKPATALTNKTTTTTPSGASQATADTSAACELLTMHLAQQVLGDNAKSGSADSSILPKATDTSISACAYVAGSSSIQIAVRTAQSQLGVSENATVFGSSRPAGMATIKGYGQAAFWNPTKHQMNVLGSNNWYIITRNNSGQPSNQSDTETVAKLVTAGF